MARTARESPARASDAVCRARGDVRHHRNRRPCRSQFLGRTPARSAPTYSRQLTRHVHALQAAGRRAMIALWSEGSRERMAHVLAEHGLVNLKPVASWPQALALPRHEVALAVLGMETGLRPPTSRSSPRKTSSASGWSRAPAAKRAENFIAEVTSLAAGDLVVHADHGIGRFVGYARSRRRARRTTASRLIMPAATSCSCRSRTSNCFRAMARKRGCRARSARQRLLAIAQVADQKAHPRDRRELIKSRPSARYAKRRGSRSAPGFTTILRRLSLRRDRRSARGHFGGA